MKLFSFWSNLIHSRPYVCSASWKKALYPHFLRSLLITCLDNPESGKRNYCLGKNSGKRLDFGFKNLNELCRLRSHSKGGIFHMLKNLTRHFVDTEPFNVLALFIRNRRTRLNFICLLTVVVLYICPWAQRYFSTSKMTFSNYVFAVKKFRRLWFSHHADQRFDIPTKNLISILFNARIFNRSKTRSLPVWT